MKNGKISYVNIIISVNDDGYMAQCPGIQGAFAEGDTVEEAVFNCIDVLKMIADYRKERSEKTEFSVIDKYPDKSFSVFEDLRGFGNLAGLMSGSYLRIYVRVLIWRCSSAKKPPHFLG